MIGRDQNVPASKTTPKTVIPTITSVGAFQVEVRTVLGNNETASGASDMSVGATS